MSRDALDRYQSETVHLPAGTGYKCIGRRIASRTTVQPSLILLGCRSSAETSESERKTRKEWEPDEPRTSYLDVDDVTGLRGTTYDIRMKPRRLPPSFVFSCSPAFSSCFQFFSPSSNSISPVQVPLSRASEPDVGGEVRHGRVRLRCSG